VATAEYRTHVLFIVPTLRRAGAETQLVDLVNGLPNDRYTKTMVVFEDNVDQLDRVDPSNVDFRHIVRQRKIDREMIDQLARLIDEQEIDVIHCTLQISMYLAKLAVRQSVRSPAIIAAIHTTLNVSLRNEWFDRFLYVRHLKQCSKVVFVCHAQAEFWKRKYPGIAGHSVVVYNGVDTDHFDPVNHVEDGRALRRSLSIDDDHIVVACIAGFRPEKGHDILIRAFARLPLEVHLVLAGDGPLRADTQALVDAQGLSGRVHFLGNIADVRPLLGASDLSVLASTAVETFSIAMLESMSMGVPMVVTDIGGLREAVIEGQSGSVVDVGSADALYGGLSTLLADQDALAALSRAARGLAIEKFSVKKMVDETDTAIRCVI